MDQILQLAYPLKCAAPRRVGRFHFQLTLSCEAAKTVAMPTRQRMIGFMKRDHTQKTDMAWHLIRAMIKAYRGAWRGPGACQPVPWKLVAHEAGFRSLAALRNWRRRIDWECVRAVINEKFSADSERIRGARYGLLLLTFILESGGLDAPECNYIDWDRITRVLPYRENLLGRHRMVERLSAQHNELPFYESDDDV